MSDMSDLQRASVLPDEVNYGLLTIADVALHQACKSIATSLESAGFPITGDVSPDEDALLMNAFVVLVRRMALNNPAIAAMHEDAAPALEPVTLTGEQARAAYAVLDAVLEIADRETGDGFEGDWVASRYDTTEASLTEVARLLAPPAPATPQRTIMVARFDVTDLPEAERDRLALEVAVQCDHSDADEDSPGHRSVPEPAITFETEETI